MFGRSELQREMGKVVINRSWSMSRLHEEIWTLYSLHPLELVGVKIGHCDKGKKISILHPESANDLIQKIGRGKILIIPNRDLPIPSPAAISRHQHPIHEEHTLEVQEVQDNSRGIRIRRPAATRALESVRRVTQELMVPQEDGEINSTSNQNPSIYLEEPLGTRTANAINSPHPSDIELDIPTWTDAGTPSVSLRLPQDNSGIHDGEELEEIAIDNEAHMEISIPNSMDMEEIHRAFILLEGTLSTERADILVNRQTMVSDLLEVYSDPTIITKQVRVSFIGEEGDDFGGVTKDLFTGVWKKLIEEYFKGESAVVPYMPLHRQRKEKNSYIAIGRILSHTTALLKILPPRLSRSCILCLVFGGDIVDNVMILKDFCLYLTHKEMLVVRKAVRQFKSLSFRENEKLTNIFAMFGFLEQPKEETIEEQVLSIARSELIDKPAPLMETIRKGIPQMQMEVFWSALTIEAVDYLFSIQKPTTHKVIEKIDTNDQILRPEEDSCLYYLKQYISSLDQEDLESFLLFVTGSTVMPDKITIQFSSLIGAGRRLIAHTCSNTLELPTTYISFQEFKREARALLTNENSFVMNML